MRIAKIAGFCLTSILAVAFCYGFIMEYTPQQTIQSLSRGIAQVSIVAILAGGVVYSIKGK